MIQQWKQLFSSLDLNWSTPLSAGQFRTWVDSRPFQHSERVSETVQLFTLVSDFGKGPLKQAILILRRADYHPVEERFVFLDSRQLQVTELMYKEARLPIDRGSAIVAKRSQSSGISSLRSNYDLGDSELQARTILHDRNADLGEQININRTSQSIEVRGYVDSFSRKQELVASLERVPSVHIELKTFEEASRTLPVPGSPRPLEVDRPGAPLLGEELKARFPSDVARASYVSQLLQLSSRSLARGHALKELAQVYTPALFDHMNSASAGMLRRIIMDHVDALREDQTDLEALVHETQINGYHANPMGNALWQSDCVALFDELQWQHDNLVQMFVGSSAAGDPLNVEQEFHQTSSMILERIKRIVEHL
jgi:hypothetical protein